jgi:prophage maintenance system killer protein
MATRGCSVNSCHSTVCGEDVWPSVAQKAAALFHSLICNHCFINGNKRTAVIALDFFVVLQGHFLILSSDEIYEMAKATAQANHEGKSLDVIMSELATQIGAGIVSDDVFSDPDVKMKLGVHYERVLSHAKRVIGYIVTAAESIAKQKLPTNEAVDRFFSGT